MSFRKLTPVQPKSRKVASRKATRKDDKKRAKANPKRTHR
jgi:hypothetical protein